MYKAYSETGENEFEHLIFEFQQLLEAYDLEVSSKRKLALLKKATLISQQIANNFHQKTSNYHLMNMIKENSIEIFDHQVAFRTKFG